MSPSQGVIACNIFSLLLLLLLLYISIQFVHSKEHTVAQLTLEDCLGCKVIPGMWPLHPNIYSEGEDAVYKHYCITIYNLSVFAVIFEPQLPYGQKCGLV